MIFGCLNHVGVATPSIGDSIAFYCDVMGAQVSGSAADQSAHIEARVASHYKVM